ncbi:MAG: hypothetical protein HUU02_11855 [Bacteroidetes bacterium]|nr:hypothetical protein [Bacteroidota bacterium]
MIQRTIPNPYQRMYRTLIAAAFLMNIPAVMMMMSGNSPMTSMFGLIQFVMFGAGVALLVHGKSIVRSILHLLNGPMLVHWSYETDQWTAFAAEEFRRRKLLTMAVMTMLLLSGPAAAFVGIGGISVNDGMLLGAILGFCGFAVMELQARGVLRRSALPPFEAFIAADGAFINGVFIDWSGGKNGLTEIRVERNGKRSEVVIDYTERTIKGRQARRITVPVPAGEEQNAAAAAEQLNRKRLS